MIREKKDRNNRLGIKFLCLLLLFALLYFIITNHCGGLLPTTLNLPNDDISEFYVILNKATLKFIYLFIVFVLLYSSFYKSFPKTKSSDVIVMKAMFIVALTFFIILITGFLLYSSHLSNPMEFIIIVLTIDLLSIVFLQIQFLSALFLFIFACPILFLFYKNRGISAAR